MKAPSRKTQRRASQFPGYKWIQQETGGRSPRWFTAEFGPDEFSGKRVPDVSIWRSGPHIYAKSRDCKNLRKFPSVKTARDYYDNERRLTLFLVAEIERREAVSARRTESLRAPSSRPPALHP